MRELAERQQRLLSDGQRGVGHAVEQHGLRLLVELTRGEARREDTRGVGLRLVWLVSQLASGVGGAAPGCAW